jgi:hypothetical protein
VPTPAGAAVIPPPQPAPEIDQNGSNTWDIDEIYTDAAQGYLKRM